MELTARITPADEAGGRASLAFALMLSNAPMPGMYWLIRRQAPGEASYGGASHLQEALRAAGVGFDLMRLEPCGPVFDAPGTAPHARPSSS